MAEHRRVTRKWWCEDTSPRGGCETVVRGRL
jgi:hypothetical protein